MHEHNNHFVGIDHAYGADSSVFLCDRHLRALGESTKKASEAFGDFSAAMQAGFDASRKWHGDFPRAEGYDEPIAYDQSKRLTHPHPMSHKTHERDGVLHDDCVECYPNSICHKCHHVQPCPLRCR